MNKTLLNFDDNFKELSTLFNKGKLPKVLMLSGEKGQGKCTLIYHLLSYIFDKNNYSIPTKSINLKNKLFNGFKDNSLSNIIYLSGEDKDLKIEKIRNLKSDLQKSTLDNNARYVVFDDVELMNVNCTNALLRIIEEPTYINHFILINNKSKDIMDTIRSRCIEKKIFLNVSQKNKIIDNLIKNLDINDKINYKNTHITPGFFLIFNGICEDENIMIDDELSKNVDKLLKLFKQKKDNKYVNFLKFLINYHFNNILKSRKNITEIYEKQLTTLKMINNFNNLNLNGKNLINEIENIVK